MTQGKKLDSAIPSPTLAKKLESILIGGALPGELEGFVGTAKRAAAAFVLQVAARRTSGKAALAIESMAADGGRRQMRLAIINDDMPFLVDSISAELAAYGLSIDRVLHPVAQVEREKSGQLITVSARKTGQSKRESFIYMEIDRADAKTRRDLESSLKIVLDQVRDAVADWHPSQAAMRLDSSILKSEEGAELLRWFGDNNFTMLGHAMFGRDGHIGCPLGIAKNNGDNLLSAAARKNAFAWFDTGGEQPLVLKSNLLSPVHRRVPLELVLVPRYDKGRVKTLSIHAGLWTSAALNLPPRDIPVLRTRLAQLEEKFGFDPMGHAGKALTHAITTLPHDMLIGMDMASLEGLASVAMSLADRPRPSLAITQSPLGRHLNIFVWLPRDDLTTTRRNIIAAKLSAEADAPLLSWSIDLDDSGIAMIRFTLDIRAGGNVPDANRLNKWLEDMLRGWHARVENALLRNKDVEGGAARLTIRFADTFPTAYREGAGPEEAARDIVRLHDLITPSDRNSRLYRNPGDAPAILRLKLYSLASIALSDAVPALENFGFRVLEEQPTALDGGSAGWIHRFILELPDGHDAGPLFERAHIIEEAVSKVLEGSAENDHFNQLMVTSALGPQDALLFRALFRYLRQTGLPYGLETVVHALRAAPLVAKAIVALFNALHDPSLKKSRKSGADTANLTIDRGLAAITAIDDDRILRQFRAVIRATLRTNMFAPAAQEAIAFKIDSARVPGLPSPVPWREIFVYSPRVEGIHLRAGPVARGGLRWSDRRDDFRTEILGLMKAQRVKNAVIVPTGAKGGFYPKMLPEASNRDQWLAEGTESYRIFIRTLLSVTDNLVEGKVVHPDSVVIHDGDDPYFVVAADKGTATFSDIANAIAIERNFWLGDAFASGGSVGYDHKAMGITAKGGWVSVTRHFAEAGIDVQSEPVRVVGCGDMSGDVFGNGMLLSKAIKLVAAFDHRHIFFDPDPDPAASWKERARIFKLPRSSWMDYSAKLISKGGGIFPRSAKEIKLTPQMRDILGVADDVMEPSALIAAILKSPADLLWFGGIGTYVKARAENNAEAGDRANDAHRINAEDLRVKVIGEGANLGLTQAARIVFALKGGRINTDFIDNSAGVDCSDNEVNIKIALNSEVALGALTMAARNALLVRMTDDVSTIVLEDNRLQTLALSIAQRDGADNLSAHIRLIQGFEQSGKLNRAVEGLAPNDELIRRAQDGQGLTRPELAVVLATAKLALQEAIELCGLGADPAALSDLMGAFPKEMQKRSQTAITSHRLRNEIVATKVANRIINRLGLIHPFELAEEEGADLGDVAEAFVIAEQIFDASALWAMIDTAQISESTRLMLFEQVAIELRAHMADILRNAIEGRTNDTAIAAYRPMVEKLSAARDRLLPVEVRQQTGGFGARLTASGAPKKIVDQLVRLAELDGAIGLSALSTHQHVDVIELTAAFTEIGSALSLDWAQGTAMQLDPRDPWERLLAGGLARDFQTMRLDFLKRCGGKKPLQATRKWIEIHKLKVVAFRTMVDHARVSSRPSAAMMAQIAGQARVLLSR